MFDAAGACLPLRWSAPPVPISAVLSGSLAVETPQNIPNERVFRPLRLLKARDDLLASGCRDPEAILAERTGEPARRGWHLDADGNLTVVWQLALATRPSSCTTHFSAEGYASRSSLPRKSPRTSAGLSTSTPRFGSCISWPRSSQSTTTLGHCGGSRGGPRRRTARRIDRAADKRVLATVGQRACNCVGVGTLDLRRSSLPRPHSPPPTRSAKRDHLVECEPPGVKLRALGRGNTPRSRRGERS